MYVPIYTKAIVLIFALTVSANAAESTGTPNAVQSSGKLMFTIERSDKVLSTQSVDCNKVPKQLSLWIDRHGEWAPGKIHAWGRAYVTDPTNNNAPYSVDKIEFSIYMPRCCGELPLYNHTDASNTDHLDEDADHHQAYYIVYWHFDAHFHAAVTTACYSPWSSDVNQSD